MSSTSVLACVLYTGEPSLASALKSLETQRDVDVRLIMIGYHPKHQAHKRLFETLNRYEAEHEFSIFLGADMELVEPRLLASLTAVYRQFPTLDEVMLGVNDWYSGEPQLGVLSWRRGVRHTLPRSSLFTDVTQSKVRSRVKIHPPLKPLILHGVDPSEIQAIRYGAQRGSKAAVSGKASRWERLEQFVEFAAANPHSGRRLALAGVLLSLEDADLGMRCISGEVPLSSDDLNRIRSVADSPHLVDDLNSLMSDPKLRIRLTLERTDQRTGRWQRPRPVSRLWPVGPKIPLDREAVERTLYSELG